MKTPRIKILNKVTNKGYPINNPCYIKAHRKANKAEIEHYGKRKFDKLNKLISILIPKDELAGKHTRNNTILISKKIPQRYRNQIKFHELIELDNMKSKSC